MPGMNGTGPLGQGAMTGGGRGPCGRGLSRGFGRGMGYGAGMGRGFGRGRGFAGWAPGYGAAPADRQAMEQRLQDLEAEARLLREQLAAEK